MYCLHGTKHEVSSPIPVQAGFDIQPQEDTPLLDVLQLGLEKYLDQLTEISSQASKEFALEKVHKLL